ncbi:hypothetical protein MMC07_005836 [Pseudocyphellaria aurata]|nr:hypothetical protein [Pseudocyphellaria aurata]
MEMSGMSMGGMSMGDGIPSLFDMQKMYWAAVGAAIATATAVNIYNKVLCRQRLVVASQGDDTPAKPKIILTRGMATMMAMSRELTYASLPLVLPARRRWTSPTLGRVVLVSAEFVLTMVLCFYKLNPNDQWQWEDVAYRIGFVALAQLPLVVLLAGKNNIIGFLIGSSYERLNWLHRWTARILFLTVTLHMGFWFVDWARYDYIKHKMATDLITRRGFAAWCVLLWIVLSSFAPIRRWNYEFFVIQHIVTITGFAAAVYLHIPAEVKVWVWMPIGFAIFDRLVRALMVLYANVSIFHPKRGRDGFWACKATLEPLGSDMTRIIVENPPIHWSAGQHLLLSCHQIAPLQSHPFTIASIPQDGKLVFLVKSKTGGTKRIFKHAQKYQGLPMTNANSGASYRAPIVIEGPYGNLPSMRQFDSVLLIAGSSGGTFTVPLMRDIVFSWKSQEPSQRSRASLRSPGGTVTRYIRFVWVVKSRDQFGWFAAQLTTVAQDVEQLRSKGHKIQIDMSIYITCDEDLVAEGKGSSQPACPAPIHGTPVEQPVLEDMMVEDEKAKNGNVSMHSARSRSSSEQDSKVACGPTGTCCCSTTIEDETDVSKAGEQYECHCGSEILDSQEAKSTTNSASSTGKSFSPSNPATSISRSFHPAIALLSGRPQPKHLIRKMVEQALGESAVVVCGPPGLVDDVRHRVVALSDERAVHKGSGAQGIYLHTEAFDY